MYILKSRATFVCFAALQLDCTVTRSNSSLLSILKMSFFFRLENDESKKIKPHKDSLMITRGKIGDNSKGNSSTLPGTGKKLTNSVEGERAFEKLNQLLKKFNTFDSCFTPFNTFLISKGCFCCKIRANIIRKFERPKLFHLLTKNYQRIVDLQKLAQMKDYEKCCLTECCYQQGMDYTKTDS